MAYENITNRYKALFNSQNQGLVQKKNAALAGYKNEQSAMNNQYTDMANSLKTRTATAKSQYGNAQKNLLTKYNNMYTGLDQQNVKTKDQNYTDRNTVDTTVNQNLNRVQEIMAKNGWSGGGENLQAQLNSNSDRMNGFGGADKSMNEALTTSQNNRNTYQANQTSEGNQLTSEQQNIMNEIDNQTTSNTRERNTKLQAILDAITSANVNYAADSGALKSTLDAQAQGEIQQAQAQAQAQAQSAARASASRKSSGSSGTSGNRTESKAGILAAFNSISDAVDKKSFLDTNKAQIIKETGAANWQTLENKWAIAYKAQVKATPNQYASWNMQNLK